MITGHVFIATSLDGFIARKTGDLDWLMKQETEGEDYGYDAFMASVDGLIMGRGSFEKVLSFDAWPYEKPVIVMSASLAQSDIPEGLQGRVTLSRERPVPLMEQLAAQGWRRAYVDGAKVIQSFLAAGLIEDITLTRAPVLIGSGLALFGPAPRDIDFEHVDTKPFPSGLVQSRYRVIKNGGS